MFEDISLSNLFGIRCIFCKKKIYNGFSCFNCESNIKNLNKEIHISKIQSIKVASRFYNENWVHEMLCTLKNKPNNSATIWITNEIKYVYNKLNCSDPILVVPGNTFEKIHLVEKIAIELQKQNIEVISNNLIKRIIFKDIKQKKLNIFDRKSIENKFKFKKSDKVQRVVLFDDIITTGQTIKNIIKQLEVHNTAVTNVISIAYTKLKADWLPNCFEFNRVSNSI